MLKQSTTEKCYSNNMTKSKDLFLLFAKHIEFVLGRCNR